MKIYACSSNPGKLAEFQLAARESGVIGVQIEPLPCLRAVPPAEESGSTFEENASKKARYYSAFTPELVLADDSGLEVPALNGQPGIYSARYAGPNATDAVNNELLLSKLQHTSDRNAQFVCVIALARAGYLLTTARGIVRGELLTAPRGHNGFGYDPLFFYPPLNRCFAELTPEEKFAVSHRGRALRSLFHRLNSIRYKS